MQRVEARRPGARRVEGFIRCGKATGLRKWPSSSFAINTAWVIAAAIAIDLLCWTRLLLLDGPLAKAEPATLRYRMLHAAARLVNHSRMLILRIPETWPWAQELNDAFDRFPDQQGLVRTTPGRSDHRPGPWNPGHRTTRGAAAYPLTPESRSNPPSRAGHGQARTTVKFRGLLVATAS